MRRKHNRRDPQIAKEFLMTDALSSYDAIALEKKWITQDSKSVTFSSFSSKVSAVVDKLDGEDNGHKGDKFEKKKTYNNCAPNYKQNRWKCEVPKANESKFKEANGKTHNFCDKYHCKDGKTMWALCEL